MHNLYLNDLIIGHTPQEPLEYLINYKFSSGSIYYIQGQNGSGKTTLMKTICGYLSHLSGELLPTSHLLTSAYYGHKIALKQQLIVKDYINFCIEAFGKNNLANDVMDTFDIANFLEIPINYLSYGQKKRVSLTGFLCSNRDIYCFDEASSNLDVFYQRKFYKCLKKLAFKHNKIILFSDHNIPNTEEICTIKLDTFKILTKKNGNPP